MTEKKLIGKVADGKYENQIDIGLTQLHLDAIQNQLTSNGTGWVNLRISRGRESNKPYLEIIQPK